MAAPPLAAPLGMIHGCNFLPSAKTASVAAGARGLAVVDDTFDGSIFTPLTHTAQFDSASGKYQVLTCSAFVSTAMYLFCTAQCTAENLLIFQQGEP